MALTHTQSELFCTQNIFKAKNKRGSKDCWDKHECQMKDGSALQSSAAAWVLDALSVQILSRNVGPNGPGKALFC